MPSEFQSYEPPQVLRILADVTPPPLWNSEMPPVVWVWIFSGTTHFHCNMIIICIIICTKRAQKNTGERREG